MRKWILALAFLAAGAAHARDGGEIGNAFVEFENKIGGYELEYPKSWQRNDMSMVTNFSEPLPGLPGMPAFLTVITSEMKGITSTEDLQRHLKFFRPEVSWQKITFAGLDGFEGNAQGVQTLYLLRNPEDLLSVRYRAKGGSESELAVRHMLDSFRVF